MTHHIAAYVFEAAGLRLPDVVGLCVKHLCDVLRRQIEQVVQRQHLALQEGQVRDQVEQLCCGYRKLRATAAPVVIAQHGQHGRIVDTGPSAPFLYVKRMISRNDEQPVSEWSPEVVTAQRSQRPGEDFLDRIFGFVRVADDCSYVRVELMSVALVQDGHRSSVPALRKPDNSIRVMRIKCEGTAVQFLKSVCRVNRRRAEVQLTLWRHWRRRQVGPSPPVSHNRYNPPTSTKRGSYL